MGFFIEVSQLQGQYPLLTTDQKIKYRQQTFILVQEIEALIYHYASELERACEECGIDLKQMNILITWLKQKISELLDMERETYDPLKLTIKLNMWDQRTIDRAKVLGINVLVEKLLELTAEVNYKRPDDLKQRLKKRKSVMTAILEDVSQNPDLYRIKIGSEPSMTPSIDHTKRHSVFIVHGRDENSRLEVENFLHSLNIQPIVLFKQVSAGKTVMEKFEHYSDVQFAVVILNGEDTGFLKERYNDKTPSGEEARGAEEDRARQNVIFEMGFFLGKLGRGRVAALTLGKVTVPSDYDGVVYIPMNAGQWKIDLAKEMTNSGLEVDMNKLC